MEFQRRRRYITGIMAKISNKLRPNIPEADQLICPNCGERLTPADVENFAACPYCDYAFRRDSRQAASAPSSVQAAISRRHRPTTSTVGEYAQMIALLMMPVSTA